MSEEIWFNMSSKAIGYQSFHMVVYVFVCQLSKTADLNDLEFEGWFPLGANGFKIKKKSGFG